MLNMRGSKYSGFTLTEVMITVAIIAIIAAVAFPSYMDSVRKSRRADATAELEKLAARQERWFTENNSYTSCLADLGSSGTSPEGHYTIVLSGADCVAVGYVGTFALTATAIGDQASDTKCATFTLNEIGARGFTGTGTARDCW